MKYLIVLLLMLASCKEPNRCPPISSKDLFTGKEMHDLGPTQKDGVPCTVVEVVERTHCSFIPGRDFTPSCDGTIVHCDTRLLSEYTVCQDGRSFEKKY